MDFIDYLFGKGFMPHGHCYFWRPDVLWLHVISDSLITIAYYSIPLALIYFVRKRKDLAFDWMFLLFATFIFACGTTHALEIWTVWNPIYPLQGIIKALTALASIGTAIALWILMPKALALPTIEQIKEDAQGRMLAEQELHRKEEALQERTREGTLLQEALARQQTLMSELDHRVKNTLQVVLSLAQQTLRQSKDVSSFIEPFEGRIHALARVHKLLTQNKWEDVTLKQIVRESLQAYSLHNQNAITVDGPIFFANAKEAQSLHMVFHELATNAVKYGALSTENGKISISWKLSEQSPFIELDWQEENGPPAQTELAEGFGTKLINQTISFDLDGSVRIKFNNKGLLCQMRFKLKSLSK